MYVLAMPEGLLPVEFLQPLGIELREQALIPTELMVEQPGIPEIGLLVCVVVHTRTSRNIFSSFVFRSYTIYVEYIVVGWVKKAAAAIRYDLKLCERVPESVSPLEVDKDWEEGKEATGIVLAEAMGEAIFSLRPASASTALAKLFFLAVASRLKLALQIWEKSQRTSL